MLQKEAIVEITNPSQGHYSTFFLVCKPDGSQRPILNLKPLNEFVKVQKFKMCTPQIIIPTLRQGDWLASIDLKDAYYHVPITQKHRPYLRFAFQEKIFQYNVLPFGLSTAPRVFTKVLAPVVGMLHKKGVRLFPYLDHCLIVARTRTQLVRSVQLTIQVLGQAGFIINTKKSHPSSPEATISRSSIGHSLGIILSSQGSSSGAETSSPGIQARCQVDHVNWWTHLYIYI